MASGVAGFSFGSHGLRLKAVGDSCEMGSVQGHIGGSVDSSTSGVVSMPIQGGVGREVKGEKEGKGMIITSKCFNSREPN